VSEPGLTNQWEPWQRLIDSIGPYYRRQLFAARDRAKGELCELDEEQLAALAAEGRRVASSLDEEGTRLTVSSTEDRERHSRLATELEREAELLRRRWRLPPAPRRRRKERADAAERADRAQEHRRRAAQAHEQLRELGNSGRHLHPCLERHQHALGRGLAAELTLNAAQGAVYHVLGAPGIALLAAACLTSDRAIDLGQLQELVRNGGEARQRLLFAVAAELYGREQGVSLSELLAELDGEDLDRVLDAIAVVKRRRSTIQGSPDDLWIRAAEPESDDRR
jgi:hypothetical protein